eukprot:TRINITY_DN8828_c0_g1_i1.p1 TRINITY_DN8828_c0_g1~~TRINITY_DN8828_c0_g1_i1.p1  ORF type:complete len:1520 (+),score=147.47 TRINITY_DN8828_c0_g1_i1:42-4562(+)
MDLTNAEASDNSRRAGQRGMWRNRVIQSVSSPWFSALQIAAIAINTGVIANSSLFAAEVAFVVLFLIEQAVLVLSFGLRGNDASLFGNGWRVFHLIAVLEGLLSVAVGTRTVRNLTGVRVLGALPFLRSFSLRFGGFAPPLLPGPKALCSLNGALLPAALVALAVLHSVATNGVQLWSGAAYRRCFHPDTPLSLSAVPTYTLGRNASTFACSISTRGASADDWLISPTGCNPWFGDGWGRACPTGSVCRTAGDRSIVSNVGNYDTTPNAWLAGLQLLLFDRCEMALKTGASVSLRFPLYFFCVMLLSLVLRGFLLGALSRWFLAHISFSHVDPGTEFRSRAHSLPCMILLAQRQVILRELERPVVKTVLAILCVVNAALVLSDEAPRDRALTWGRTLDTISLVFLALISVPLTLRWVADPTRFFSSPPHLLFTAVVVGSFVEIALQSGGAKALTPWCALPAIFLSRRISELQRCLHAAWCAVPDVLYALLALAAVLVSAAAVADQVLPPVSVDSYTMSGFPSSFRGCVMIVAGDIWPLFISRALQEGSRTSVVFVLVLLLVGRTVLFGVLPCMIIKHALPPLSRDDLPPVVEMGQEDEELESPVALHGSTSCIELTIEAPTAPLCYEYSSPPTVTPQLLRFTHAPFAGVPLIAVVGNTLTILSTVHLMVVYWSGHPTMCGEGVKRVHLAFDIAFAIAFSAELLFKACVAGRSSLHPSSLWLDATATVFALLGTQLHVVRPFRALRGLCLVLPHCNPPVLVTNIFHSAVWRRALTAASSLLLCTVLCAGTGVQIVRPSSTGRCVLFDPVSVAINYSLPLQLSKAACASANGRWLPRGFHNTGTALLALLQLATADRSGDLVAEETRGLHGGHNFAAWAYLLLATVAMRAALCATAAMVVVPFARPDRGTGLTDAQRQWIVTTRYTAVLFGSAPTPRNLRNEEHLGPTASTADRRAAVLRKLDGPAAQIALGTLTTVQIVVAASQSFTDDRLASVVCAVNTALLATFTVETALRLFVLISGAVQAVDERVGDPWLFCEALLLSGSWLSFAAPPVLGAPLPLAVFRSVRLIRDLGRWLPVVFRFVSSRWPSLAHALLLGIPLTIKLVASALPVLFLFVVTGVEWFGRLALPLSPVTHFTGFPASLLTLGLQTTMRSWSATMFANAPSDTCTSGHAGACGTWLSYAFFPAYILFVSTFLAPAITAASWVLVQHFQSQDPTDTTMLQRALRDWPAPYATGVSAAQFVDFYRRLVHPTASSSQLLQELLELHVPLGQRNVVHHPDALQALLRRACGLAWWEAMSVQSLGQLEGTRSGATPLHPTQWCVHHWQAAQLLLHAWRTARTRPPRWLSLHIPAAPRPSSASSEAEAEAITWNSVDTSRRVRCGVESNPFAPDVVGLTLTVLVGRVSPPTPPWDEAAVHFVDVPPSPSDSLQSFKFDEAETASVLPPSLVNNSLLAGPQVIYELHHWPEQDVAHSGSGSDTEIVVELTRRHLVEQEVGDSRMRLHMGT